LTHDDQVYLRHILECVRRIEENTSTGHGGFLESHTLQDAVIRNLQVIAESTQRLSTRMKARHSEIEWSSIRAFRNVVVHDYLSVDLDLMWKIAQEDLPALKRTIQSMLDVGQSGEKD
jgi:uncharacterized protein with HEPN domain